MGDPKNEHIKAVSHWHLSMALSHISPSVIIYPHLVSQQGGSYVGGKCQGRANSFLPFSFLHSRLCPTSSPISDWRRKSQFKHLAYCCHPLTFRSAAILKISASQDTEIATPIASFGINPPYPVAF